MSFDTVIIGGGPAGKACAEKLAAGRQRVLLVDKSGSGGVGLNRGYFISKVLISAVEQFGRQTPSHIKKLIAERKELALHSWRQDLEAAGVEFKQGKAKILDVGKVEIKNGQNDAGNIKSEKITVETDNIVLASGCRPVSPLKFSREESSRILTYEEVMKGSWLDVERVAILGADVEGCEYASLYEQLGAEVTIVEQEERILPNCDREIADFIEGNFNNKGIEVKTSATIQDFSEVKNGIELKISGQNSSVRDKWLQFDILLLTGAVEPVIPELAEKLSLEFTEKGFIDTDDKLQTSIKNIYAAGDVIGGMASANAARKEGEKAAAAILDEQSDIDYSQIPFVFFCSPRVTGVGMREDDIAKEDQFTAISLSFNHNLRAISAGEQKGLAKLIIDEKENVLVGAHLAGHQIEEIHSLLALAVREEMALEDLADLSLAHPTRSEIIGKICRRLVSGEIIGKGN